jgi:acetyl-CoA acyltransferase
MSGRHSALIVDAVRTPSGRGKAGGALSAYHPVDLAAETLRALAGRTGLDHDRIDDILLGCVGQVGTQAVNIARNAALAAGYPQTVPGATIDRQCGSSLQAATFAAQAIAAGDADLVVAGGVEMMSRVPIAAAQRDEDPWGAGIAARYPGGLVGQGISAELVAARWGFSRDELDEFSAGSHRRAAAAMGAGSFARELVPMNPPGTTAPVARDETVREGTTVERLSALPPAFADDEVTRRFPEIQAWHITPGNSSPLTDGASAALIVSEAAAAGLSVSPRARVVATAVVGSDPIEMLTGVIPATRKVLGRAGLKIDQIDVYEVNEAFAPVPLAWLRDIGADPERLNSDGGAIALGHPLGASGTRILATMLGRLERTGGRYGLVAICEGQGMANAMIIERL